MILSRLRRLLGDVDLSCTTEKMLRRSLEKEFGVDLAARKALIRGEVEAYLSEQPGAGPEEEEEEEASDQPSASAAKRRRGSGAGLGTKLSAAMQAFLGVESLPRSQVVKRLWEYIKANELQDPSNRRRILLDDKLSTIFPGKSTDMFKMNKQLSKHCFVDDSGGAGVASGSEVSGSETDGDDAPATKRAGAPAKPKRRSSAGGPSPGGDRPLNGFTKPLRLSPEMAAWVGAAVASRPAITKHMWEYVKAKGLQDPAAKQYVVCDDTLKALTGEDRFRAFGFAALVKDHLLGYAD